MLSPKITSLFLIIFITFQIEIVHSQVKDAKESLEIVPETKEEKTNNVVVVLDKDNFDEEIKEGVTFVSFLSPDSENWKRLAPTWEELAANNLEGVKIGTVNCRADGAHGPNRKLCVKNGVNFFLIAICFTNYGPNHLLL